MTSSIDAVICWVNGADSEHQSKLNYWRGVEAPTPSSVASDRFTCDDELIFCVKSLIRNVPFVGKIFIVTDNQDPHKYYKDGFSSTNEIVIVDHRDIFPHWANLPTFDSQAIEGCIHRIDGLSENFLYLNDDYFVIKQLRLADLINKEGKILVDCEKRDWFNWNFSDTLSYRHANIRNGVEMFRRGGVPAHFYMPRHYPFILSKSVMASLDNIFTDAYRTSVRSRFRNNRTIWPLAVHHNLAIHSGIAQFNGANRGIFFGHDAEEKYGDLGEYFFDNVQKAKFLCINNWSFVCKKYPLIRTYLENILLT